MAAENAAKPAHPTAAAFTPATNTHAIWVYREKEFSTVLNNTGSDIM